MDCRAEPKPVSRRVNAHRTKDARKFLEKYKRLDSARSVDWAALNERPPSILWWRSEVEHASALLFFVRLHNRLKLYFLGGYNHLK